MSDKVMRFLIASGASTIDEILARVPARPHNVVDSLIDLADRGFLRVTGPRGIEDFRKLVADVRRANGYDAEDKLAQRTHVLHEIIQHRPEFTRTVVSLTPRGQTFGL